MRSATDCMPRVIQLGEGISIPLEEGGVLWQRRPPPWHSAAYCAQTLRMAYTLPMNGLRGFIAYASQPPAIGATIESAKQRVNTRCGDGTLTSWMQNDIPGRFVDDPIWQEIRKADILVADISVLNFNVIYEIG